MCCPCSCTLAIGAIVAFVLYKLFCCRRCCRKEPEIHEKNYRKDVVYLYQFPRSSTIPNVSPYCLKIESFLRLNKIDYENRYTLKNRSRHGLLPFIELNGEQIADSQIIEETLKKHFNIESHHTEYEDSVARATERLVSHHTTRIVSKYRYIDETDSVIDSFFELAGYPNFLKPLAVFYFKRKATKGLKTSFGLFSDSEFDILLRKDLDAVKGILGEKSFFLGDKISNVDASIFGHVATWYYMPTKGHVGHLLDEEYPTIVAWAERVKQELFANDFTK